MTRWIAPFIFGVGGVAVLIALAVWQLQRLEWKTGVLAEIDSKIMASPVDLPDAPTEVEDEYLPVRVSGMTGPDAVHILTSTRAGGPGYRLIQTLDLGGRVILIDRGYFPEEAKSAVRPPIRLTVEGNLLWPDEVDMFTPEPDLGRNIWFARDLPAMAEHLRAAPILVVVRSIVERGPENDPAVTALPVDSAGVPNNHLQYAITWFLLAAVWAGMTGYFLKRQRKTG